MTKSFYRDQTRIIVTKLSPGWVVHTLQIYYGGAGGFASSSSVYIPDSGGVTDHSAFVPPNFKEA